MRISALTPQEKRSDRYDLHVDGEFRLGLAAEIVLGAGLHVGDAIDEAKLADLERQDQFWRTRQSALNLLAYRARSEDELRRRLLRKGYPEDAVEKCVQDFVDRGFLDDAAFASAFVRDRVRGRPRGARRLVAELRQRGVEAHTAASAVDRVLGDAELSETDLAREAAAKWARRARRARMVSDGAGSGGSDDAEDRRTARRRLFAYLARRGFGAETIREVADEVIDSMDD